MLVLSRREGQRITIGSGIEIVVTQISGNRVKLGISAPPEVPVHREELLDRLQHETSHDPGVKLDAPQLDCVCCE